ncbi:MAG TPA: alkaline phosphatase family protein [Candidatus Acidoferrales bacterium]|nr:alkaline phosphatase family protein [Candidatus Acidoferrales bacterium]
MKIKLLTHRTSKTVLLGAAAAGVLLAVQTAPAFPFPVQRVGDIFVIALENHNFTQPTNMTSPQQIFGNPAAPYINSLITPGNSNAVQVSYATAYFNAAIGDHPSEPNYVWAEAGTDFGVHTDADPRAANGNTFYDQSVHFAGLLNAANIPWKNYQEDVDLSLSPTNSASGTNGPVNTYNGTTQYNYAVKHNPMAFFADTATANVYPLAQFFLDLHNGTVGRYNWITPDQYNEAHSSLNGGFTYQGVHYTGDQSSIAAADNFLSQVIPQIMASPEYQDNGVIVLWWDEAEGGDDTNHAIPEIIISPLAKGNAYASSVPLNHSSDIKTWSKVFHLPFVSNPIPTDETDVTGIGYNNVAVVNDLSDLFVPGAIPAPAKLSVKSGRLFVDPKTHHAFQLVFVTNTGFTTVPAPVWLVLDNLSANATVLNAAGTTSVLAPLGSPYVSVPVGDGDGDRDEVLYPFETRTVLLEFLDPNGSAISYDTRALSVTPAP